MQQISITKTVYTKNGSLSPGMPATEKFYEAFGPAEGLPANDTFWSDGYGKDTFGSTVIEAQLRWLPSLDLSENSSELIGNNKGGHWAILTPFGGADKEHVVDAGFNPTHPYDIFPTGWLGAGDGLRHALTIKWCNLASAQPWVEAETVPSTEVIIVPGPISRY